MKLSRTLLNIYVAYKILKHIKVLKCIYKKFKGMFLYLAGRKNTSYERSDFAQTDISCQIYFPKMLKILNDVGNFIIWRKVIM